MMLGKNKLTALAAVAVIGVAGGYYALSDGGYSVEFVVPSAANLVDGSPVWIDGYQVGSVEELEVRDGKAIVHASIDDEHAPLREGTKSFVEWKSALGERIFTVNPGPASNPEIPDGGRLEAESRQVEVDQVLSALDAPTRKRLTSLLDGLDKTMSGSEADLRETIRSAGPAVAALGNVLQAVGRDGPAIKKLVADVREMTKVTTERREDISGTVRDLASVADSVAARQGELTEGLRELPETLRTADETLSKVPKAGSETVPLLRELRPATQRLPGVARNLQPLLRDVRPAIADLRPVLAHSRRLLQETPGLMDVAHGVLPQTGQMLRDYGPAMSFLRPYTPELVGFFHNWGKTFAPYDSQGHVWAAALAPGTNMINESVVQPPGSHTSPRPDPGEVVGQPWTDAHGSGMR